MFSRMTVCSFLYTFGVKEGSKEDYMQVGEYKAGKYLWLDLRDEKVAFHRDVNLDAQKQCTGLAKINFY